MKKLILLILLSQVLPAYTAVVLSSGLTSTGTHIGTAASTPPVFSGLYTEITNLSGITVTASNNLDSKWTAAGVVDSGSSRTGDAADWTFGEGSETAPDTSGWIPRANGTGTGDDEWIIIDFTGTSAGSFDISGVDFITLFDRRADGTFSFSTTTDSSPDGANAGQWTEVGYVTNDIPNDQFRAGFTFTPVAGATALRLELDNQWVDTNTEWGAIGELDVYAVIPEPSSLMLVLISFALLGARAKPGSIKRLAMRKT